MQARKLKHLIGSLLTIFMFLGSIDVFAVELSPLLIDDTFVKGKIGKPGWVIVDMRFPEEYEEGHIPGAVMLPEWIPTLYANDTKRSETVIPMLEQEMGALGISNDSHVILYGSVKRISWNAVMFWILELMGCNSDLSACTVSFFDGGIEGWQASGGEITQEVTQVRAADFRTVPGTNRGVKVAELLKVVQGESKAVIVDVRTAGEYAGTDIRALRGGHIPTAVNIDYAKNYNPETSNMLPVAELRQIYKEIPVDSRVITHCQTGQRAAYGYLALRVLGFTDVAIYHDGWRVYGSNLNLPVADETWFDFSKINTMVQTVQDLKDDME